MQGKNFILFVAPNFTLRRTPKGICNEERAEKETFFSSTWNHTWTSRPIARDSTCKLQSEN